MEDIAPILLEQIEELFKSGKESNERIKAIIAKLDDNKAGYIDVGEYADELGAILADAYGLVFTLETLPDGKLYYNIATRTVEPTMKKLQSDIADITENVQKQLNQQAGLGIKPIRPELNQDKIVGIVDRLSNAENIDDVKWILDEPIKTFARSIVDDAIKANAEFQGKSGMSPKIIRRSSGNCCKWCTAIEGSYEYPDVPKDVYRRHNRCRCTVDYVVGKRKQDAWSKTWNDEVSKDKIDMRKSIPYGGDVNNEAQELYKLTKKELEKRVKEINETSANKLNKLDKKTKGELITFIIANKK